MGEGNIIGKTVGGIFGFFFKNLRRTLITLGFILIFYTAITQSWEQKNFQPFVTTVGGSLLTADHALYKESLAVQQRGSLIVQSETDQGFSFLKTVGAYSKIVGPLYFIVLMFLFVLGLLRRFSMATDVALYILAIFGLMALIITTQAVFLDETEPGRLVPFKGVYNFVKIIPFLSNPVYQSPIIQNNLPGVSINSNLNLTTYQNGCASDVCVT